MKKIFYLSTCSTCSRIIKELGLSTDNIEMQDIKSVQITEDQINEMKKMSGSYESIFSRRSMKYKAWSLNEQTLNEDDYKKYILEEYTFLKRPVIVWNDEIFVGNSKKVIEAAAKSIKI